MPISSMGAIWWVTSPKKMSDPSMNSSNLWKSLHLVGFLCAWAKPRYMRLAQVLKPTNLEALVSGFAECLREGWGSWIVLDADYQYLGDDQMSIRAGCWGNGKGTSPVWPPVRGWESPTPVHRALGSKCVPNCHQYILHIDVLNAMWSLILS